jgi:glutathione reductase (NADPH)
MSDVMDLVVIGGGSGGVAAARRAASYGARVALIERDRLGGTCVIRGCVPKKLMMYAGRFSSELKDAVAYGWSTDAARFSLEHWQQAKRKEIDRLENIYAGLLDASGVEHIAGNARLLAPDRIAVGERVLQARNVLIATGGSTSTHAMPGLAHALSSDAILDLSEVPASLGVIGAGYIGLEFASILAGMGSRVDVFFRDELPLRGFDRSLRERLAAYLELRGIRLHARAHLEGVGQDSSGSYILANGSSHRFAAVLNATGRHPNSSGMGLEQAGVNLQENGAIAVDAFSRTSVPNIYAVGDVTNRKNLTPVAIAEGRAVADNLFDGQQRSIDHHSAATATFTHPPLASVGMTEQEAAHTAKLRVYEAEFRPMKTAFAGAPFKTYIKLVVDDASDKVLGIHMAGEDAPEIIQALAVAYTAGATKADFDRTIALHPTAAEEFMLMRAPSRVVEKV